MKNFVKLNLVLASITLLAGCASTAYTYQGDVKPATEVAIIKAESQRVNSMTYSVSFSEYRDLSGDSTPFVELEFGYYGYPTEIHMLPGRYSLTTVCEVLNAQATITQPVVVEAGKVYHAVCTPHPSLEKTVLVEIKPAVEK